MSDPDPPKTVSKPPPPLSMSSPEPPLRRSLPAPPDKISSPEPPTKLSLPLVPVRTVVPLAPVVVVICNTPIFYFVRAIRASNACYRDTKRKRWLRLGNLVDDLGVKRRKAQVVFYQSARRLKAGPRGKKKMLKFCGDEIRVRTHRSFS